MSKDNKYLLENIKNTSNLINKNIKNIYELNSNSQLKNYFVKSSWASYSSTGSNISYSSYEQLKQTLIMGARFIHLNIHINTLDGRKPVVRGKNEQNDKNINGLEFDLCCKIINNYGFENENISSYPLFLYLELMYDDYNVDVSNQIAESIIKNFNTKMPDIKYSYARKNLAIENIENFRNKIIILLNHGDGDNPRDDSQSLKELVHAYIKNYDYLPELKEQSNTIISLKPNDNQKGNYNLQSFNLPTDMNEYPKNRFIFLRPNDNNTKYKRFNDLYNFDVSSFYKLPIQFIPFKILPFTIDSSILENIKDSLIKYTLLFNHNNVHMPIILLNKL